MVVLDPRCNKGHGFRVRRAGCLVCCLAVAVMLQSPGHANEAVEPGRTLEADESTAFTVTELLLSESERGSVAVLFGEIELNNRGHAVTFPLPLQSPVVITGPATNFDPDPGIVRLKDVGHDGFHVRFQEWDYLNGLHADERVPFLVAPKGRYDLPGGIVWELGTFELGGGEGWQAQRFTAPFPGEPAVFASVQSENDPRPVMALIRSTGAGGFEATLTGEEASESDHGKERVGYLAVYGPEELMDLTGTGVSIEQRLGRLALDASQQPVDEHVLWLEEEASADRERRHPKEQVSVLQLGPSIFSQVASLNAPDPVTVRRYRDGAREWVSHSLWDLARRGRSKGVAALLSQGQDVNITDRQGRTALWWAAQGGRLSTVRVLLEGGADPNIQPSAQDTVLLRGLAVNHLGLVRALLDAGADPSAPGRAKLSPLQVASTFPNPGFVAALISAGAAVDGPVLKGELPVINAVLSNNSSALTLLLRGGGDPNVESSWSHSALHLALGRMRSWEMSRLLLEAGADPNKMDGSEWLALIDAAEQRDLKLTGLLIAHGADVNRENSRGVSAMRLAVDANDESFLVPFLKQVAAAREASQPDPQALLRAVEIKDSALAEGLIAAGADVGVRDRYGRPVLTVAVLGGSEVLVRLLLGAGAAVDGPDRSGSTPLAAAAEKGNATIFDLLIESGANPAARDRKGESVLELAVGSDFAHGVRRLGEQGADLRGVDDEGRTLLMKAARGGAAEVVKLLLESGLDVNALDDEGKTALIWAVSRKQAPGRLAVVEALLGAGADPSIKDAAGLTVQDHLMLNWSGDSGRVLELLAR